mmetsp:Transcript_17237/g.19686  ORF Transcript_17237/g.19686 Transcript_17237/m.19686 type:complete len:129 (+) Transcript_17237:824-1210(+)
MLIDTFKPVREREREKERKKKETKEKSCRFYELCLKKRQQFKTNLKTYLSTFSLNRIFCRFISFNRSVHLHVHYFIYVGIHIHIGINIDTDIQHFIDNIPETPCRVRNGSDNFCTERHDGKKQMKVKV